MSRVVPGSLWFRAGPAALARLRAGDLTPEDIRVVVGASGGPKWLVLSQLDRALIGSGLLDASQPTYLLGSSIGAWRLACHARRDPLAAIERFESVYIAQRYSAQPDIREITAKSREILDQVFGAAGADEIVSAPNHRLSILTARARGPAASERRALLGATLGVAALANAVSRKTLGWFFERALFYDARDTPPFLEINDRPLQRVPLSADNFADAVLASGAIPMVLEGVRDIAGAPPGIYRDGGITDYHFDMRFFAGDGIALYPHFYPYLVPGWFDKSLGRRARAANIDNVLVVCPSPQFVATLPNGKIPDRQDFVTMDEKTRIAAWQQVTRDCERLADEFRDALDRQRIGELVRPLDQRG